MTTVVPRPDKRVISLPNNNTEVQINAALLAVLATLCVTGLM